MLNPSNLLLERESTMTDNTQLWKAQLQTELERLAEIDRSLRDALGAKLPADTRRALRRACSKVAGSRDWIRISLACIDP